MKTNRTATAPSSPDTDDVSAALRLLAESLEEEEKRIRNEGSKTMNEGDYDTATVVIDFAKRLLAFQKKVAGLEYHFALSRVTVVNPLSALAA